MEVVKKKYKPRKPIDAMPPWRNPFCLHYPDCISIRAEVDQVFCCTGCEQMETQELYDLPDFRDDLVLGYKMLLIAIFFSRT